MDHSRLCSEMSKLRWVCSFLSPLRTYTYLQPRSICRTTPIDVSRRALGADATLLMTLNGALDVTKVAHARRLTGVFVYSLKCGFRCENASRNFHTIDQRCDAILSVWVTNRFFLHFEERTTCLDFPVERSFDKKIENVKGILRILLIHVISIINLYFSYLLEFCSGNVYKSFN